MKLNNLKVVFYSLKTKKEFYVEILMKLTIEEMEFEMKLLTKKITNNVKNKEKLAWQFWATIVIYICLKKQSSVWPKVHSISWCQTLEYITLGTQKCSNENNVQGKTKNSFIEQGRPLNLSYFGAVNAQFYSKLT